MISIPTSLLDAIDRLLSQNDRVVIAIDGPCTSGKTTLAEALKTHYGCNIIPMDDFFLQPHQRTDDRLAEPGGNVDYERFAAQVLHPLEQDLPFSYRPYNCSTCQLDEPVSIVPGKLTVIEGTYSHHPYFNSPYDLKVLLSVTPETQRSRILERPEFLHQRFFHQWIPMENTYFRHFSIAEQSDLII